MVEEELIISPLMLEFVAVSLAENCDGQCEGFSLGGKSLVEWGPEQLDITLYTTLTTPIVDQNYQYHISSNFEFEGEKLQMTDCDVRFVTTSAEQPVNERNTIFTTWTSPAGGLAADKFSLEI